VTDAIKVAIHTNRFTPHGVALNRASPTTPPTKLAIINEIPNLVFSVIDTSHQIFGRTSANAENAESAENAEEDWFQRLQNTSHSFDAQVFNDINYFTPQSHYPQKSSQDKSLVSHRAQICSCIRSFIRI
jgi:hypothetical protein